MRKIYCAALVFLAVTFMTSCDDDSSIWEALDSVNGRVDALEDALEATTTRLNNDISALQTIVNALQKNLSITEVNNTADGYEIKFTDGTVANISNGRDGAAGKDGLNGKDGINAPVISIGWDYDGNYYWTLDGDWLYVEGQRVRANGQDGINGTDGKDGVDGKDGKDGKDGMNGLNGGEAPSLRINEETKEWEISTDNGQTWHSMGVVAEGKSGSGGGNSLFKKVSIGDNKVIFYMTDGSWFEVAKSASDRLPQLETIAKSGEVQIFSPGKTTIYNVSEITDDYKVQTTSPKGWTVGYDSGLLTVIAPQEKTGAEESGTITVSATAAQSRSAAIEYSFEVSLYELRILTFEDEDARFEPYEMPRGDEEFNITKWSDLVDSQQYGGSLLYGDMDSYEASEPYYWYDEGNTELKHVFPESYGQYMFWSGGHAISNYGSTDIEGTGDYASQLTVYGQEGSAGHNGSSNFCVHFGYMDDSSWNMTSELPALEFGDKKERIIDHMWVMPTNYALNCYANGNSLTSKLGDDDYVKITAIGYSSGGKKTKEVEIVIANGDKLVSEWTKWDLTGLGKVQKVEFNILGSSDNGYGFSQPAYFAYDDVAVRFYGE